MLLRYEWLMDYCFRCDRIGHVMDECMVEIEVERDVSSAISKKLAVWLRASSPLKRSFRGSGRTESGNWGKSQGEGGSRLVTYDNRRSSKMWRGKRPVANADVIGGYKELVFP
ncbi:hypothetical protein Q3G72_008332 [Acer saccharum]|nr:hypothetical protein Q3G72_008332 [Acer saccharum]